MAHDHRAIEAKWQARWEKERVFSATTPALTPSPSPRLRRGVSEGRDKVYVLDMFPYPSGDGLHVGHPEGYAATDIYSRYLRMNGKNVLHPMGWDAFGLPAENAAIKKGIHPRVVTEQNVKNFKRQIQSLGFSYDWDREVNTTDPKYYKWTQWIFLQLFKKGLAYEKEAPIWWCPKDKTGLANEEVVNGKCDRCGTAVEKKMLKQWMLKITAYAERLLSGLDNLDWPEGIKTLQRNWIGKSVGVDVRFKIKDVRLKLDEEVVVFTTRPDTLFGATYLVLSPEHELVSKITSAEQKSEVERYKIKVASTSDLERTSLEKEKTGVFTGAYAVNPANNEKIPVWIADYVLISYGTGAIMAVPAHDERDFAFAKKFGLEIREVATPPARPPLDKGGKTTPTPLLTSSSPRVSSGLPSKDMEGDKEGTGTVYTGEGVLMNSGKFNGLSSEEARLKIVAALKKEGHGQSKIQYKLRDWVFSRQRYWGEPIPVVKCESCRITVESTPHHLELSSAKEWQAWVDEEQTINNAVLAKIISSDAKHADHYVKVTFGTNVGYWRVKQVKKHTLTLKYVLPGIILVPESELPLELPNVEKYEPTGTGESPLAAIDDWVNVPCRVCGQPAKRETNTMPQWAGSCWYYLRFCDPHNSKEFASAKALKAWLPVDMYVGGAEHAVLHLLYARFWHKVLFDAGFIPKEVGDEPFKKLKNQGLILGPDGEKMSKSRGNVINPDEIVAKYGADTLRMYEMFMGPFEDAKPWSSDSIVGVRRFLEKVWRVGSSLDGKLVGSLAGESESRMHRYIKLISEGIENFRFNTGISDFMKWTNEWQAGVGRGEFETFLKLLSPFAPHITEELWLQLGHKTLLAQETWPKFNPKKIKEETVTIAMQVMGKLRGTLTMQAGATQAEVEKAAKAEPNVVKYLTGEPKKVIFVKDRLINFVI